MNFTGVLNRWGLFAAAVLALAVGLDNEYYFTLLNFIGIHTLLVVGLNLLLGYAGQISLGLTLVTEMCCQALLHRTLLKSRCGWACAGRMLRRSSGSRGRLRRWR